MSEVNNLEYQRSNNEILIGRRDRAERLAMNADFKELILNQFMVVECANYVHTSANVTLTEQQRADALGMAQASGYLKKWLQVICQMGNHAESQMEGLDQAILEARQEESE